MIGFAIIRRIYNANFKICASIKSFMKKASISFILSYIFALLGEVVVHRCALVVSKCSFSVFMVMLDFPRRRQIYLQHKGPFDDTILTGSVY